MAEYILDILKYGPKNVVELIEQIKKERPGTTKQGVYASLRKLKKQEEVVIHHKQTSLNLKWLNEMSIYFSTARSNYIKQVDFGDATSLDQKEKIEYYFSNPAVTDAFWGHLLYMLIERQDLKGPIFLYNPHCWFFVVRSDSEKALRDFMVERGAKYFLTVHGRTPLDQYITKEFRNDNSQYHMSDKVPFPRLNYYLNLVGEFIIEVWINPRIARDIENLYHNTKVVDQTAINKLNSLINSRGRSRLVVSRNKLRADKLAKMFSKNFYIQKSDR